MTGPLLYIITYRKQCLKVLQKITVLAACLITHLCKSMWRLFCQQHHRGLLKRFSYIYFGDSTLDRYLQYWRYHSPTLNKKYIYLYIFKACSRNCSTNPIKQFSYLHFGDNIRSLSSILEIPQSYTKQEICIYIYSGPARDIVQQIQCHFLKSLRSWDILFDNYTFPMIYLLLQCDKETQSMINRSRYNIVYIKTLYVEP